MEKYSTSWRKRPVQTLWKDLMLTPHDYGYEAVFNQTTRKIMDKIQFVHGGAEYDRNYPDGIPTRVKIVRSDSDKVTDSQMVMYPGGHARNQTVDLKNILDHKFRLLGNLAVSSRSLNQYSFKPDCSKKWRTSRLSVIKNYKESTILISDLLKSRSMNNDILYVQ